MPVNDPIRLDAYARIAEQAYYNIVGITPTTISGRNGICREIKTILYKGFDL